jgi:hypothetical protein
MAEKSLPKINPIDRAFWQGAAEGKLLIQKCRDCGKLQFFPRVVCTGCFSTELDWVQTKGDGKVHSFSWVFVPRNPAFKEEAPICYANIILEEGVIIESRIVGKNAQGVKTGAKVRVVFQETADPAIKLPVFELAE